MGACTHVIKHRIFTWRGLVKFFLIAVCGHEFWRLLEERVLLAKVLKYRDAFSLGFLFGAAIGQSYEHQESYNTDHEDLVQGGHLRAVKAATRATMTIPTWSRCVIANTAQSSPS